jgi:ribosome-associated protein
MKAEAIKDAVIAALENLKGKDIAVLDVRKLTGITDYMVICSGTSNRHVKALAENVEIELKKNGHPPMGTEGIQVSDWALVDLGDVVVHVMTSESRAFYDLERLWSTAAKG